MQQKRWIKAKKKKKKKKRKKKKKELEMEEAVDCVMRHDEGLEQQRTQKPLEGSHESVAQLNQVSKQKPFCFRKFWGTSECFDALKEV
uniref:Uncharacterized protein n=1 Tax=Hyaloperonospora arabidopsidis (strain Emoy2) TaxID=559515 RepID=M4BPK9_HYAAE